MKEDERKKIHYYDHTWSIILSVILFNLIYDLILIILIILNNIMPVSDSLQIIWCLISPAWNTRWVFMTSRFVYELSWENLYDNWVNFASLLKTMRCSWTLQKKLVSVTQSFILSNKNTRFPLTPDWVFTEVFVAETSAVRDEWNFICVAQK